VGAVSAMTSPDRLRPRAEDHVSDRPRV